MSWTHPESTERKLRTSDALAIQLPSSSLCKTIDAPDTVIERDDGWKGFRIQGVLDFSLIGILSKISGILAENNIGIFAVSTFNTDYILVKAENFERALCALSAEGYIIV